MNTITHTKKPNIPSKDLQWKCSNCQFVLGFLDQNAETLRIKHKDLYITVTNGDTTITCRRCGKMNALRQNSDNAKDCQEQ